MLSAVFHATLPRAYPPEKTHLDKISSGPGSGCHMSQVTASEYLIVE